MRDFTDKCPWSMPTGFRPKDSTLVGEDCHLGPKVSSAIDGGTVPGLGAWGGGGAFERVKSIGCVSLSAEDFWYQDRHPEYVGHIGRSTDASSSEACVELRC